MRRPGSISVVAAPHVRLPIDREIAEALGLTVGAYLYMVATPADQPTAIVASSFPTSSWPNLMRASIAVPAQPGAYRKLVEALTSLRLYVRSVQAVDALPIASAKESRANLPSALVTFEVPKRSGGIPADRLRELLGGGATDLPKALTDALIVKMSGSASIRVEWISPMLTLNELHTRLPAAFGEKSSRRKRERVVLEEEPPGSLFVRLEGLVEQLWPKERGRVDRRAQAVETAEALVFVQHADTDEQTLCWHVRPHSSCCIARFEVIYPAGGMDHMWIQWIFKQIESFGGNVLVANSTARFNAAAAERERQGGKWAKLLLIVEFPFEGEPDTVALITDCLRALQAIPENLTDSDSCFAVFPPKKAGLATRPEEDGFANTPSKGAAWPTLFFSHCWRRWKNSASV